MSVVIGESERELLGEEVLRFCGSLAGTEARAAYEELLPAVASGEVSGDLLGRLERLLEIVLESGGARRIHGPEGERRLLEVFGRTPHGTALQQATRTANQGLGAVIGQRVERLSVVASRPGAWRVVLATDRLELTLELDRQGVRAREIEVAV